MYPSPCHARRVNGDEPTDDEDAFLRHLASLGVPPPYGSYDARRLGLDRNTEEGALLAFSGSLRPDKPAHRAIAWVLLASFGLPVLFAVLHYLDVFLRLLMP
jgi:hypothetical protein